MDMIVVLLCKQCFFLQSMCSGFFASIPGFPFILTDRDESPMAGSIHSKHVPASLTEAREPQDERLIITPGL